MKCILMNKNTEVLIAEYVENLSVFSKIYEIKNIDYAPVIISSAYLKDHDITRALTDWFKNRGIPSWRDKLDILLSRLNIASPEVLLNKAFALSLSDQYWIKNYDSNIKYDDINFFDHDFDASEFVEVTFSNIGSSIKKEATLRTPNNTTDGMLRKAWIIKNDKRVLIKGGYKNEILQPFNEVLASMVCECLGFDHVKYELDIVKDKVVSKCECFINKDTELIPAYQILHETIKEENNAYEEYIKILENHGIKKVREKLENMYILDFLIMNEDRHLNNFGIIRNVNTLEWIDIAPIFDNGQSLNVPYYNEDEAIVSGEGRFFYNVIKFDEIIKIVKDLKRIDIDKLNGIVEKFANLLHEYQDITHISDKRIDILCNLLNRQIEKLTKIVKE